MTMLEKAARALCERTEGRDDVWDDMSGSDQNDYMESARTVLMAVKGEAEALKWVGHQALWNQGTLNAEELAVAGFTAMIDAILTESDNPA